MEKLHLETRGGDDGGVIMVVTDNQHIWKSSLEKVDEENLLEINFTAIKQTTLPTNELPFSILFTYIILYWRLEI